MKWGESVSRVVLLLRVTYLDTALLPLFLLPSLDSDAGPSSSRVSQSGSPTEACQVLLPCCSSSFLFHALQSPVVRGRTVEMVHSLCLCASAFACLRMERVRRTSSLRDPSQRKRVAVLLCSRDPCCRLHISASFNASPSSSSSSRATEAVLFATKPVNRHSTSLGPRARLTKSS